MMYKKVSVCIATYNGEKYIKEQLDSILPQLSKNDEVIISDDSSTDGTIEIIKNYRDSRIKIIENQKFKSPIFNFENSLKNSSGDLIFLSDQDDKWMPDKVEEMVHELENYDLVISDCYWFGNQANGIVSNFEFRNSRRGVLKNLYKNSYIGNCLAFRKEILEKALPFPKDIPMHDIWIGLVSDAFYRVLFINKKLSYWRRHEDNSTKLIKNTSPNNLFTILKFRFILVKNLFKVMFNMTR